MTLNHIRFFGRRYSTLTSTIIYVAAQLAGATLAGALAPAIRGGPLPAYAAAGALGEVIGVGFLVLTVLAVSTKSVPKSGSGVAIGAALLARLLTTHGVLNPAIALAMGLGLSAGLWAPLAGALVFAPLAVLYLPTAGEGGEPAPTRGGTEAPARTARTGEPPPQPPPPASRSVGAARPWRAGRRGETITFTARRAGRRP